MYKLTENGVLKDGNTWITENGAGWSEYQQWLAEGNTPEPQYTPEEIAENTALEAKITAIIEARELSDIKDATVQQAYDFIDNKFDNASNADELKEAIRDVLKKMVPFILN